MGMRVTPLARLADLHTFPGEGLTWLTLAVNLSRRKLAYLHASHLGDGGFQRAFRAAYRGTLMLAGGFDAASARQALDTGAVDLAAV
jgi:2,4-dienoyl-CoA reductase-like NADH-dependent reductase (Old Yellow Enzyme family)